MQFFAQILVALEHVHSRNIMHRDLKTQNIMLCKKKKVVKIGDFGISKVLSSKISSAKTVSIQNADLHNNAISIPGSWNSMLHISRNMWRKNVSFLLDMDFCDVHGKIFHELHRNHKILWITRNHKN